MMRGHPTRCLPLLLTLAALAFGACSEEELTQLMVVVDTDFEIGAEIDEISLTVIGPDLEPHPAQSVVTEDRLPLRLAVVHRGGELGPVQVKAEGLLGGAVFIQRRAVVYFVRGEVRELRLDLLKACESVRCEEPEHSCGPQGCRPWLVGEDELPLYEGPMRLDAGAPDMGPVDMTVDVCVPQEELCNGMDDDCDDAVDESFDLQSDMRNCGICGNACDIDPAQGSSSCVAGACVLVCDDQFADCNDEPSDGCEAHLASAGSCGSCALQCTDPTPVCDADVCAAGCPIGTTLCGGDTCADLTTSTSHCGTCGNACVDATNASPTCTDGSCAFRCDPGFFDCDGLDATGCESRHRELANCGACGASCAGAAAITSCATGNCEIFGCNMGFDDCDGDVMNGCEADLAGDPATCGGCTNACPIDPANGTPTCSMGLCGVDCDLGYRDCDGDPANGCEIFLGDPSSCGGCGILCDGTTPICEGSPSTSFACTASCGAGLTPCLTTCVDLTSDVRNCGACDAVCADPMRASPTCTGGSCGFTCDTGFEDCDGDAANGCEADTTSTSDCGSCGVVCDPVTNANIACEMGSCAISGCVGTARDCDGSYASGCEVDVASDPTNCGACGRNCSAGVHVMAVGCTNRACVIESCEVGFADCDGDFATGCEANLGNRKTCGSCDVDCGGGPDSRCCGGTCGGC